MDIKSVYKQLTNVDIERQKQLWDERGKGYYGEYLLFCELYKVVPGKCKILMNLNIPTEGLKTTEIDLILIHETGLYVFEIKHYKGTIYGNDTDANWTQYFRTAKNNVFKNPVEQNKYHISALTKLLPETPIHSCIVFTNYDCTLKVKNSNQDIDICHLNSITKILKSRFKKSSRYLTISDIDNIFEKLSPFSQMSEQIKINEKEADFFSWVQPTISMLEEKKSEIEKEKNHLKEKKKKFKKTKIILIINCALLVIVCALLSALCCFNIIKKNNNELAKFKQNFLHVDQINNEYIDSLNSYVNISNIELQPLTDDAVSFSARITLTNGIYMVALTENSKYIVMTKSGKVFEYDVFGEHNRYSRFNNEINPLYANYKVLKNAQFYGINNVKDISYIKITGVELLKADIRETLIKDDLEIELYSK